MTSAIDTRLIREADELMALMPQWWALWRCIPSATPFQSPAWLLPWWENFAPGELYSAAAYRDGQLVGLAPFYLETGSLGRRLLPIGISISDYLDVLVDPACEQEAGQALTRVMSDEDARADWELPELRLEAQALALPCPSDFEEVSEQGKSCPYLPLPPRADDLRAALPPRKRRSLAMNRNRAERRGPLTFHSIADMAPEALLAELIRLHASRWESRGEPGVLCDARVKAFHESALPGLVAAGLARLYALRIGEVIAAAYYGFIHNGSAYGYLTGIDPTFAHESPGTLLLAHAMEEAIREGTREFDFLRGGEAYKYGWGAQDRWNQRRAFRRRHAHAAA